MENQRPSQRSLKERKAFEAMKDELQTYLLTCKTGMEQRALEREIVDLIGKEIDYRGMGIDCWASFLYECRDCIEVYVDDRGAQRKKFIFIRFDSLPQESSHIGALVRAQDKSGKTRRSKDGSVVNPTRAQVRKVDARELLRGPGSYTPPVTFDPTFNKGQYAKTQRMSRRGRGGGYGGESTIGARRRAVNNFNGPVHPTAPPSGYYGGNHAPANPHGNLYVNNPSTGPVHPTAPPSGYNGGNHAPANPHGNLYVNNPSTGSVHPTAPPSGYNGGNHAPANPHGNLYVNNPSTGSVHPTAPPSDYNGGNPAPANPHGNLYVNNPSTGPVGNPPSMHSPALSSAVASGFADWLEGFDSDESPVGMTPRPHLVPLAGDEIRIVGVKPKKKNGMVVYRYERESKAYLQMEKSMNEFYNSPESTVLTVKTACKGFFVAFWELQKMWTRVEVRKLSDDNDSYVNAYAYDYAENILVNVAKGHLRHMVKKLKGVPKSAYLAELSSDCVTAFARCKNGADVIVGESLWCKEYRIPVVYGEILG